MDLKAGSLSALIDLSEVQLTKGTLSHKELVYYGFKPMFKNQRVARGGNLGKNEVSC